ncbi:MAG: response regulator [Deltaproteobacteria bacterium]|nr:response regulator [Deltaproteobacteria bacterium]
MPQNKEDIPAGPTAVVVNDSPIQLKVLSRLLSGEGIHVLGFESAEAALSAMDANDPPDVIVTDLYMPGIDGWRFCRLLGSPEYKAFNQVPVLVVSATFAGEEASRITADLGPNACLLSPVDANRFVEQVQILLSGGQPGNRHRVLIVEDSRTLTGILKKVFEARGYDVETAPGFREAKERLSGLAQDSGEMSDAGFQDGNHSGSGVYDIAVIDYHLPDGKGDDLLRRLNSKMPDCVCIMMTSDPDPGLALAWMKQGAAAYVRKPFEPEYLIELCAKAHRERSLLRVEDLLDQRTRELQQKKALYATLFEYNPNQTIVVDRSGKIVSYNRALMRSANRPPNPGDRMYVDYAGDHHEDMRAVLMHCMESGEAAAFPELKYKGRMLSVSITPFPEDSPTGAIVLSQDITEQKQVEAALRESEERYRAVVEKSPTAIAIVNDAYRFVFANDELCQRTGYTRDEIIGRPFFFLLTEESRADAVDRYERRQRGEDLMDRYPFSFIHKNGDRREAEAQSVAFRDSNGQTHLLIQVLDITEQLHIEQEKMRIQDRYRQAQKVEAIGRLAGGVAHDLNNLLSPVLLHGEMLMDELGPDDARRRRADQILQAGLRARDLVQQLLAFSRKQTLAYETVDINQTIDGFMKLLRRTIREDIEIKAFLGTDVQPVKADIGQIEQVIINLSVNAQDAMPDGGRLTLETSVIELDQAYAAVHPDAQPGEYVMLAVSDTGHGMDEETQAHVFEPFFSTKGDQGTGLGLATVYGIVKQHGGNIWLYSEPGKGTTFKIYLPVSEEAKAPKKTIEMPEIVLCGSETILLAEDNKMVSEVTHELLRRLGYPVLTAENGARALEILDRHDGPIDLLLTDVVMPEMNGRDLFERAARKRPGIQVLYMSGYTDDVIAHRGVLDEGVPFIQKPFTMDLLATKVREVLEM